MAVERVFSQHNVRTVMGTAQASAVAIVVAARRGLPVALHTPSEVKAAVTGSGRADKAQVGSMVTRLLRLDEPPKPADAADALALAICHIWRGGAQQRIAAALAASRPEVLDDRVGGRARGRPSHLSRPCSRSAGVGIAVQCTPTTLATLRLGEQARLSTSLVVREDTLTFYGFLDDDERVVFELLQTATGVGPRLAQAALAVLDARRSPPGGRDRRPGHARPRARYRAEGRAAHRPGAQGPSRGTGRERREPSAGRADSADGWRGQVHSALLGLGWSAREADDAVAAVATRPATIPTSPSLLRLALQTMSQG